MNNEQVTQLIKGIGMMTELYLITYQNFKKLGLSDKDTAMHTKVFMSAMFDSFMETGGSSGTQEVK